MLSDEFNKRKNNHLLGMAIGALHPLLRIPQFYSADDLKITEERIEDYIDIIFCADGTTLEHSIHYQVFNTWQLVGLIAVYRQASRENKFSQKIQKVVNQSADLLNFFIKPNGEYHLIGDTFCIPAKTVVEGVKNEAKRSQNHSRFSLDREYLNDEYESLRVAFVSPEAGLASFRYQGAYANKKSETSLVHTCGWHSIAHKQDDELSFSLFFDGDDLLSDPGYTDLPEAVEADFRAAWRHNTVVSPEIEWSNRFENEAAGSGITHYFFEPGLFAVRSKLLRMEGVEVKRTIIFIQPSFLFITDQITSEADTLFDQNFSLAPGCDYIELDNNSLIIERKGFRDVTWNVFSENECNKSEFDNFIISDRGFKEAKMIQTKGITFQTSGKSSKITHVLSVKEHWDGRTGFHYSEKIEGQIDLRYEFDGKRIDRRVMLENISNEEDCVYFKF